MKVRDIPLEKIFITKNVRFEVDEELGELIGSTQRYFQLQPIGVYPRGERYELVWGHRRYRAAQMSGESTIAAHILENICERDIPLIKLQENMVRKQLSTDEILAAAAELQKRNPGMSDRQVDQLLGKRPGYLSYHRGMAKTYQWLAQAGLKKEYLSALTGQELVELKGRLQDRKIKRRQSTFHRGERVPREGFDVVVTSGPNVVVVCASKAVKSFVVRSLRKLARGAGQGIARGKASA